jgi:hypothetical protein
MTKQQITVSGTFIYSCNTWNHIITFPWMEGRNSAVKKIEASDLNCDDEKGTNALSSIFVFHWYSFVTTGPKKKKKRILRSNWYKRVTSLLSFVSSMRRIYKAEVLWSGRSCVTFAHVTRIYRETKESVVTVCKLRTGVVSNWYDFNLSAQNTMLVKMHIASKYVPYITT